MDRIVWHWTAGTNTVSKTDTLHYHEVIDGEGRVYAGVFKPEDNMDIRDGRYAAHTQNCNSGAIGIAVAGMFGAKDWPFSWGRYPLTEKQIDKLVERTRYYVDKYNIPLNRVNVLSHAEVEPTLGIKQRGKWDISVLPGMDRVKDPVEIGDELRRRVENYGKKPATTLSFWGWLRRLFTGG